MVKSAIVVVYENAFECMLNFDVPSSTCLLYFPLYLQKKLTNNYRMMIDHFRYIYPKKFNTWGWKYYSTANIFETNKLHYGKLMDGWV